MNTFSYCGISSDTYGVYWVPNETTRFEDRVDYDVYADDSEWHDGGVYYGNKVKPREFSLDCYYEDIDRKTKEKIMAWLGRNTKGRLVFELEPWKYYIVRPTKQVSGREYTHRLDGVSHDVYSGTFTITFTAYDPFGYVDASRLQDYLDYMYREMDTTDMRIWKVGNNGGSYLVSPNTSNNTVLYRISTSVTVPAQTFLIPNIGTETVRPVIRIGGTCGDDGVMLRNLTNGTKCKLLSLPEEGYLEIDCTTGVIRQVNGTESKVKYDMHDYGFLSLEPCGIMHDDYRWHYDSGNSYFTVPQRQMTDAVVGKCIYISNKWYKIDRVTESIGYFTPSASSSVAQKYGIFTVNEIDVSGDNIDLTKFDIEYVPLVQ